MTSRDNKAPWRNRISRSGTLQVAEALANPCNFRTHPPYQRDALSASLENVGWVQQVVVNERSGHLIDGHLRLSLAEQKGESELPCLFVDLSNEEERLILASLDPIAAMASAERDKLSELLASIDSEDEAVRTLLERIAREEHLELPVTGGLVDPDSVPEPPAEPASRAGDLWLLGEHRLMCGDSTDSASVTLLMNGERASLMFTDPPYLVDYEGGNHPDSDANKGATTKDKHWDAYLEHADAVDFYRDFLAPALEIALTPDAPVYQCFGIQRSEVIWSAWKQVGLLAHQVIIWRKSRPVLTYSWFLWDYEPIMCGWVEGNKPKCPPPASTRATWEIDSTEGNEDGLGSVHPTIKPVELLRQPIEWHTKRGGLLYEPFSGSGTALVAAEQTGRRCYAMELSPAFVDVAVERWQRFSGQEALLDGDGRRFAEVAAERCGAGVCGSASASECPSPAAHTKGA